jgi:hypothetical protein
MVPQLYFSSYHIFLTRKQRVNDPFHQRCVAFFSSCGYENPAFLVRHRRHFFDNDVDVAKQHALVGDTASISDGDIRLSKSNTVFAFPFPSR